jgi:hypothetical protein
VLDQQRVHGRVGIEHADGTVQVVLRGVAREVDVRGREAEGSCRALLDADVAGAGVVVPDEDRRETRRHPAGAQAGDVSGDLLEDGVRDGLARQHAGCGGGRLVHGLSSIG